MPLSEARKILLQTNVARDKAEALLEGLVRARHEAERCLETSASQAIVTRVTVSRGAVNQAIDSTQKLIDRLGSVMDLASREMNDEAMNLLDIAVADYDCCVRLDETDALSSESRERLS